MEKIRIRIRVGNEAREGERFAAYSDDFDGAVDYDNAIGGAVPYVSPRESDPVWGVRSWAAGTFATTARSHGFAAAAWGLFTWAEMIREARYIGAERYGPRGDGFQTLGAKVISSGGLEKQQTAEAAAYVNTFPRPPRDLEAETLVGGIVTLSFTPSPDL